MSEEEKKANKKIYLCDVEKNKECNKRYCYINGGPCNATTDKTKAINNMSEEIIDIIEEILQDPFVYFSQDSSYESVQIKATAIQELLKKYKQQQKEIQELKKGNKSLIDSRKKWKERYYKEKEKNKTIKQESKDE